MFWRGAEGVGGCTAALAETSIRQDPISRYQGFDEALGDSSETSGKK
jgi:hypothetical protein